MTKKLLTITILLFTSFVIAQCPPTFSFPTEVCKDTAGPVFPSTSDNGINGSWSPLPSTLNTSTPGDYSFTFTPDSGQSCAQPITVTIRVKDQFGIQIQAHQNPMGTNCAGTTYVFWVVPTGDTPTSTLSYQWYIKYAGTSTYVPITGETNDTFTSSTLNHDDVIKVEVSSSLSCTSQNSSNEFTISEGGQLPTVNVSSNAFSNTICEGESVILTASGDATTYTWDNSLGDGPQKTVSPTQETTYKVTGVTNGCSSTKEITIYVNQKEVPTFTFPDLHTICEDETSFTLPTISNNAIPITGTWNPSTVNYTTSGMYVFTPTTGQCATQKVIYINVNLKKTPVFYQIEPICLGDNFTLPTTSLNDNIIGSWSPAIDNQNTKEYTFTPNPGQCATTTTMTVVVNQQVKITPTFASIPTSICNGDDSHTLPIISDEGITGTWQPAIINSTTPGIYLFTPAPGECATKKVIYIDINPKKTPVFYPINPICAGESFSLENTSLNGIDGSWSPAIDNTQTTDYRIYLYAKYWSVCKRSEDDRCYRSVVECRSYLCTDRSVLCRCYNKFTHNFVEWYRW